ncbi:MAG: VOC family protein [Acidobacteria bacterium]|nr:VOC family protein [Acidobacteriota bacterium]
MPKKVKAIPDGWHTVTPHLVLNDTAAALGFYKKAFGAEEINRMPGPGGHGVMHAEVRIGNSMIMMADEYPSLGHRSPKSMGGTTFTIHLYVEDVDRVFDRAVKAGCKVEMPVSDMFWGDRYAKLLDPFGHRWSIATHTQDLTPKEIEKGAAEFFAKAGSEPCEKK